MKKRILGKITAMLVRAVMTLRKRVAFAAILTMLLIMIIQPTACNLNKRTLENQQSIPQVFRLLAVEANARYVRMQSGQYLIKALKKFSNWNNGTSKAYIHLLNRYNKDEIINEAKPSFARAMRPEKGLQQSFRTLDSCG